MKPFALVCLLCGLLAPCFAIDREAFTFTKYDLNVRIEAEQQRLGARGSITLRNDSQAPQKNVFLQISSSLNWRSIQAGNKAVQFVTQPYVSDIDHTGSVSEAIVSLPQAVAPKASVELQIAYEGTIALDVTRLKRIGVPEDVARHTDWDQISPAASAVRGIGYVAWYPVATESVDLTEPDSSPVVLGRWTEREAESNFGVKLCQFASKQADPQTSVLNDPPSNGVPSGMEGEVENEGSMACMNHEYAPLGRVAPSFALGPYTIVHNDAFDVYHLPGHNGGAEDYALASELAGAFVQDWFGMQRQRMRTVDIADMQAAPYESGTFLFTPLASKDTRLAQLTAVHQFTHAALPSPRPWIYEGAAHFAQAVFREQQSGRQAALDYMAQHRDAVIEAEKSRQENDAASNSLINTTIPELYRTKAMYVWWMLRDVVGEAVLKKALQAYDPEKDKAPAYMQQLLEGESKHDLEWFFDDWVYRDRGLPDFRVASVIPRALVAGGAVFTITVENTGDAGAEVPVTLRTQAGDVTQKLLVPRKGKSSLRLESATPAREVVVNDGSVLESDPTNNVYKIPEQKEPAQPEQQ